MSYLHLDSVALAGGRGLVAGDRELEGGGRELVEGDRVPVGGRVAGGWRGRHPPRQKRRHTDKAESEGD